MQGGEGIRGCASDGRSDVCCADRGGKGGGGRGGRDTEKMGEKEGKKKGEDERKQSSRGGGGGRREGEGEIKKVEGVEGVREWGC